MSSRFLHSLVAAAVAAGRLRWPVPRWLPKPERRRGRRAAGPDLAGFKMGVNRGETGAPEADGHRRRAHEKKPPRQGAEWRGNSSHPSAEKDEEDKAAAKKADGQEGGRQEGRRQERGEGRRGRRAVASAGQGRGRQAPRAGPSAMDMLREKLAAKLGAKPAADGKYAMQVSNRGESGENVITLGAPQRRGHRGRAPAAARRPRPAAGDANLDIAANAGQSLLPTHWDYAGDEGPDAWGRMRPEFSKCATGKRQSPIDIRGGIAVDLEPIRFDYRPARSR